MVSFLTKSTQHVVNLQARLYIKQNKVILDKKSIDWMLKTSDAFMSFLESSDNRAIADLLWANEEGDRVEYIMKLLQEQIRYLKKRNEYEQIFSGSSVTEPAPAQAISK